MNTELCIPVLSHPCVRNDCLKSLYINLVCNLGIRMQQNHFSAELNPKALKDICLHQTFPPNIMCACRKSDVQASDNVRKLE